MNPSIQGWADMITNYGPLWVTTDEGPGKGWAIHARIIVGMTGNGTAEGTTLDIIDPNGGRRYKESFGGFLSKFESEALDRPRDFPLRIQIVHWPAGVKAMSFGRRRVVAHIFGDGLNPNSPREALRGALVSHGVSARRSRSPDCRLRDGLPMR
jgi:Papain-like cysteine protease AvrRpt2